MMEAGGMLATVKHTVVAADLQDVVVAVCRMCVATVVVAACIATLDVVDKQELSSVCLDVSCRNEKQLKNTKT